jgi:hypothetical protein
MQNAIPAQIPPTAIFRKGVMLQILLITIIMILLFM